VDAQQSKKDKKLRIVLGIAVAAVASVAGVMFGRSVVEDNKTIATSRSDDPKVQAFYNRLVEEGLGNMRRGDAMRWAAQACNGTDGIMGIWDDKDASGREFSLTDNLKFKMAAQGYCGS